MISFRKLSKEQKNNIIQFPFGYYGNKQRELNNIIDFIPKDA
jgi:hypothetical protein